MGSLLNFIPTCYLWCKNMELHAHTAQDNQGMYAEICVIYIT